jgi:hypothetical protein
MAQCLVMRTTRGRKNKRKWKSWFSVIDL